MTERKQVPFRILRSTWQAARNAVHHLKGVEGAPHSLDALADEAIVTHVERLQDRHNAGAPFPPAPAKLPTTPANIADIARRGTEARQRKRQARRDEGGDT